jgi:hypothetical protein
MNFVYMMIASGYKMNMQRGRRVMVGLLACMSAVFGVIGCGKDAAPRAEPVSTEAAPNVAVTNKPSEPPAEANKPPVPTTVDDQAKPTDSAASAPALVVGTSTAKVAGTSTTATAAPNASTTAGLPVALEAPAPTVVATPAVPEAPPAPPVESPKQTAQAFSVWLQSSGRYSAGQQGMVEAVVVPKGEFHCNQEYPYKFVTSAGSSGVTFPKSTVRGEGLSVSTTRASMRIPFVPQSAGDAKIGGTFHFSVCTDSQCVVEKRDVFVTVKVQ